MITSTELHNSSNINRRLNKPRLAKSVRKMLAALVAKTVAVKKVADVVQAERVHVKIVHAVTAGLAHVKAVRAAVKVGVLRVAAPRVGVSKVGLAKLVVARPDVIAGVASQRKNQNR